MRMMTRKTAQIATIDNCTKINVVTSFVIAKTRRRNTSGDN